MAEKDQSTLELQDAAINNAQALNILSKQVQVISDEMQAINQKINSGYDSEEFIENAKLNEEIRVKSESLIFEELKNNYPGRVKWLNEQGESKSAYDFQVMNSDDSVEYYIECKSSKNDVKQFLMTKKEWNLFISHTKNYQVFFISKVLTEPEIIKIDNLLDWILKGLIVPYSNHKINLKAERILLSITKD